MKKVYIGSAKQIGNKCIEWAKKNTPKNFQLTNSIEDCDIFISVLYDKILKEDFIKQRPCYNFHPAILPEYRGVGAYSWVLINGESKTGTTLHLINEGIDTGDIIEIQDFPILPHDTAYSLHAKGMELTYQMFKNWYLKLLNKDFLVKPQTKHCKIYKYKDLEKQKNITKFVKAFYFPGKESLYYYNKSGNKVFIDIKL
jgi:methionyl-tRNA formyltransferase